MKKKYNSCKSTPIMEHLKLDRVIPQETEASSLFATQSRYLHKLDEDVSNVVEYKIPPIVHTIWVTNKSHPHEIDDQYIKMMLDNANLLSNNKDINWQFILWTNEPLLIPHTAELLSTNGFIIKPINELITTADLLGKVYDLIDQKYYAIASEAVRYSALRDHGGIYMDTDYEVFKVPYKLMKTFDFVTGHIHPMPLCPENNMIMAKPHHPILEAMMSLLRTNLLDYDNASEVVKHPCDLRHETSLLTGGRVICISFYQKAHQGENIDIVFGDKIITDDWRQNIIGTAPLDPYSEDYNSSNVPLFGRDHYAGRWFPDAILNG